MITRHQLHDAQLAYGFMQNQASIIEREVYKQRFPEIQYPNLIPIDDSGPEWAKSITFYSTTIVGQAEWFHHMATDMRLADVGPMEKHEVPIEMAGIGYRYTVEEINYAQLIGIDLPPEKAIAARRAYEEFVEKIALTGATDKNWPGFLNYPGITGGMVAVGGGPPNHGTAIDTEWVTKDADEIMKDINDTLTGVYTGSNTVETANTLLLPVSQYALIATKRIPNTSDTVLDWVMRSNAYTALTGQPLKIQAVRSLKDAGGAGVDRMIAYNRSPDVVKLHIPMRHRFLEVWRTGPITFEVPGIFRLGGIEIRRPAAVRYADGI